MAPFERIVTAIAASALLACCSGGGAVSVPTDAVVVVAGHALTAADLATRQPSGLSPDDSIAFARAYIRSWIDETLIDEVASAEVDMDEINRLTDDYRRQLIATQYRKAMAAKATEGIFAEDSLRAFYDAHAADFVLESPLIKGVYLKVPDDNRNLTSLKRLYKSDKPEDKDRLEKQAMTAALHYDYFPDRWIEWVQVENRIPMEFDAKALADIAAKRPLEFSSGGFTYLLNVTDFLPAGSPMPFEAAEPVVRERMLTLARIEYDRRLRTALLNRAIADGTVQFPAGNPLK